MMMAHTIRDVLKMIKLKDKVLNYILFYFFKGYYRCADGMEYHGNWLKNEFDGQGVLKWPDGRRYEGGFKAGLKNGYGIYIYRDGSRYEGNWLDGK